MWRQLLRALPKWRFLHSANNLVLSGLQPCPKRFGKLMLLANMAQLVVDEESNENVGRRVDELQLSCDLKSMAIGNNEALKNLIQTLSTCVEEICDQYQQCIQRQIDILAKCSDKDTGDALWDDLIKYRVLADDLRHELMQYRTLITTIGAIVENESAIEEKNQAEVNVLQKYKELLKVIEDCDQENGTWDSKLLSAHTHNILLTDTN